MARVRLRGIHPGDRWWAAGALASHPTVACLRGRPTCARLYDPTLRPPAPPNCPAAAALRTFGRSLGPSQRRASHSAPRYLSLARSSQSPSSLSHYRSTKVGGKAGAWHLEPRLLEAARAGMLPASQTVLQIACCRTVVPLTSAGSVVLARCLAALTARCRRRRGLSAGSQTSCSRESAAATPWQGQQKGVPPQGHQR